MNNVCLGAAVEECWLTCCEDQRWYCFNSHFKSGSGVNQRFLTVKPFTFLLKRLKRLTEGLFLLLSRCHWVGAAKGTKGETKTKQPI